MPAPQQSTGQSYPALFLSKFLLQLLQLLSPFADLFVVAPQVSTVLLNLKTIFYLFLCQFHTCIMGILKMRLKIYEDREKQTAERYAYLVNPYLPLYISYLIWFKYSCPQDGR